MKRNLSKNFPLEKKKIFVIAKGANVLIDDQGFNGLVIHNSIKSIKIEDNLITVGSGVLIKDFLDLPFLFMHNKNHRHS